MFVCSCVLDGERVNNHFILLWDNGRKIEQLKIFILQPSQFSKKSKIKKYFLFLLYAESGIKQKFYCFLQVFFLCFYRLEPGKGSIYRGYVYICTKPGRPGKSRMCSSSLSTVQFYSFSLTLYKPSIIESYRKSIIFCQILNSWEFRYKIEYHRKCSFL